MKLLLYVKWNLNPEIFCRGELSIRYYSILFIIGLLLSLFFLVKVYRIEKIDLHKLEVLCYFLLAGIFIGGRVGHCLFYEASYYLNHFVEIFLPIRLTRYGYVFTGYRGIASHGAAIGVFVALYIYAHLYKIKLLKVLDMVLIFAPLCGFFIRSGNLANSEILGLQTTRPWAFVFERVDDIPRHPAQLYEALSYLVAFVFSYRFYIRKRQDFYPGIFAAISSILLFGSRFFIEFFKERQVSFEQNMMLNMGQILSIPMIIAGVSVLIYSLIETKRVKIHNSHYDAISDEK